MCPRPLRRQIGQLLIGSFDGHSIPLELRSIAREFDMGGVILFSRNVEGPDQVAGLAFEAQQLGTSLPAWVSVDQEGGRVARLGRPFTAWPPMATLGRSGESALAERFARALAAELKAVGISLDFAPVLDIHTNPKNPVIGDRALGDDPGVVARLGAVIVRALQDGGVAACGKHFPGHGDTSSDSHLELPLVEHAPDRIRAVELQPFRSAIEAGVTALMTAHVLMPALDDSAPATLSRAIVYDLLRVELGFDGVILSDDLEMRAIGDRYAIGDAAVQAIAAGCDGVLVCSGKAERHVEALESLIHAVEAERLPIARIEDALDRQRRAKERFLAAVPAGAVSPLSPGWRPPASADLRAIIGAGSHQAVAEEMSRFL